jgi:hypothetical protein
MGTVALGDPCLKGVLTRLNEWPEGVTRMWAQSNYCRASDITYMWAISPGLRAGCVDWAICRAPAWLSSRVNATD